MTSWPSNSAFSVNFYQFGTNCRRGHERAPPSRSAAGNRTKRWSRRRSTRRWSPRCRARLNEGRHCVDGLQLHLPSDLCGTRNIATTTTPTRPAHLPDAGVVGRLQSGHAERADQHEAAHLRCGRVVHPVPVRRARRRADPRGRRFPPTGSSRCTAENSYRALLGTAPDINT